MQAAPTWENEECVEETRDVALLTSRQQAGATEASQGREGCVRQLNLGGESCLASEG